MEESLPTVTVPFLEIDKTELTLAAGETATLTATLKMPGDIQYGDLHISADVTAEPDDVVYVSTLTSDGTGNFRCTLATLGNGTAKVTVNVISDGFALEASCTVESLFSLDNISLIRAVDHYACDFDDKPLAVGWKKEADGTVRLTPENMEAIRNVTEMRIYTVELKDCAGI